MSSPSRQRLHTGVAQVKNSDPVQGRPVFLSGSPYERGVSQAAKAGIATEQVGAAINARVEQARASGLINAENLRYIEAQRAFLSEHDPHTMAELRGIADGFGLSESDLFLHQHITILRDLVPVADPAPDVDGCSTFAVGAGADGPLVVKNRDFSGTHLGIQRVFLHEGRDIASGRMICVGSAGSPGAYSSGMNAAGLALVDNHVGSRRHGIGWLRYFLMTRILATCTTVEEAILFVTDRRHAGGGNIVLGDRAGNTAAIELGTDRVGVEKGTVSWRTNHFTTPTMRQFNQMEEGDRIDANSMARFEFLSREIPARDWDVAAAAALMATHAEDGPDCGPLCQHSGDGGSQTISSAIFCCTEGRLYFHEGNPCLRQWQSFEIAV